MNTEETKKERIGKTELYSIAMKGAWFFMIINNVGQLLKTQDYNWAIAFAVLLIPLGILTRLEINRAFERANKNDN